MKTIHRMIITKTYKKEVEVLAENVEEAHKILHKKDVIFTKEDENDLVTTLVSNYGTTKQDVLNSLKYQKDFCNSLDQSKIKQGSNEMKELEHLWYIEDRLKYLIENGE
jgi:hypothetical protein